MKKRLLSLILALAMVLTFLPMPSVYAFDRNEFESGKIRVRVNVYDWDAAALDGSKVPVSNVEVGVSRYSKNKLLPTVNNIMRGTSNASGVADIEVPVVTGKWNTKINNKDYGTEVSIAAPATATGYTFSGWTTEDVEVSNDKFTMPDKDVAFTGSFTADAASVTWVVDGAQKSKQTGNTDDAVTPYTYTPADGYTFHGWYSDADCTVGVTSAEKLLGDVTYYGYNTANSYNLTIHYVYADNTTAAPDYSDEVTYSDIYSVDSPAIEGYTPNAATVSGTMPAEDVEVTVTYSLNSHMLTIEYKYYGTDNDVFAPYTENLPYGEFYSVESPELVGYYCSDPIVYGEMPDQDLTIRVDYEILDVPFELYVNKEITLT